MNYLPAISLLLYSIWLNNKVLAQDSASLITSLAPDDLKEITAKGLGFYEIFGLINNTIIILAVIFSIIFSVVAVIKIVTGSISEGTSDLKEGRELLTNTVIAFILALSIYFILRVTLYTIGADQIATQLVQTIP